MIATRSAAVGTRIITDVAEARRALLALVER